MKYLKIIFLILVVYSCGSESNIKLEDSSINSEEPFVPYLSKVTDPYNLESSIKLGLTSINNQIILPTSSPDDSIDIELSFNTNNFTGTYTQEINVDELDITRYDGNFIYIASQATPSCCIIFNKKSETLKPNYQKTNQNKIRILETNPESKTANEIGNIELPDDISIKGMYVKNEFLFLLTSESNHGNFGTSWSEIGFWASEITGYQIYEVSNPENPILKTDVTMDGLFVDSRMIGNTIYIISRFTPNIEGLNYYVSDTITQLQNETLLESVGLTDLLPNITINDNALSLINPNDCYITTVNDNENHAVITNITSISINDPTSFNNTCYNEEAYGIYMTESSIYLSQPKYNLSSQLNSTLIHKFGLTQELINYKGSVEINGLVWLGGQSDFRMSEKDGNLRVISTQFNEEVSDIVDHKLYILKESDIDKELVIISTLPNENRPNEIGKPNEFLYGVRFLDNRAYAVTFEQTDPLYAIDLSDPLDPYIAGELEITGFSNFLHPVTDNLLFGLGFSAEGGIKLELFDISELSQPLSRGSISLGGAGSYSEALFNRHAFTYQANLNEDRIAIPAELMDINNTFELNEVGLYLFEINDKNFSNLASLNLVGSIVPNINNSSPEIFANRSRSFLHDNTIFYINNELIWVSDWDAQNIINGPF